MEIINKEKFVMVALNIDNETFIIYVVALAKLTAMLIHSSY